MTTRAPTLRLIIAYKLVRAGVALLAGLTLLVMLFTSFDDAIRSAVSDLEARAVNALIDAFSAGVLWAVEPKHILGLGSFLTVDGLLALVEGWALHRGLKWGVWLVVVASSLLLPFEIGALIDRVTVVRVTVLVVNFAIVGWLLHQRLRSAARA